MHVGAAQLLGVPGWGGGSGMVEGGGGVCMAAVESGNTWRKCQLLDQLIVPSFLLLR